MVQEPTQGVPAFVVHSGGALGVAGLLAAAGLWMLEWVGCVAHHRRLRANHPLGGSGDGLRAERRTAGCCHGYGGRLRLGLILLVVLPNSRRAWT